jgi:pimeloyl-ACP methyl ester carboxylesterase
VQTKPGTAPVGGDCTMVYDIVSPVDVPGAPTVILAHGFQGNRGSMAGWAEHWASWGLRVVTPNLCHATVLDADHARNGADLALLAAHLDVGPVALAGYSAGGLAAVVAAAARPDTPVLLGLDMVDGKALGATAAPSIHAPAHDIVAEAAGCNASANGVPVFAAIEGSSTVRIVEADHCDFQNPGDRFCGLCKVANIAHGPEEIQAAIFGLSTAALRWRLGIDDTGARWWTPYGAYYDELSSAGLITRL